LAYSVHLKALLPPIFQKTHLRLRLSATFGGQWQRSNGLDLCNRRRGNRRYDAVDRRCLEVSALSS
jgi:hypothetical protein